MSILDRILMFIFILIGKRFFEWLDIERSDDDKDVLALYFYQAEHKSPLKFFTSLTNDERHEVLLNSAYVQQGFPDTPLDDKLHKYVYPNE